MHISLMAGMFIDGQKIEVGMIVIGGENINSHNLTLLYKV
jgi:hypothetical protein